MKRLFLGFSIIVILGSCLKGADTTKCTATDSTAVAPAAEVTVLRNFCSTNAPAAIEHPSGIFYEILSPGSGANATVCSYVTVRYAGYLLNSSTPFENPPNPISFSLYGLIIGWQKGIPLVKSGGSIRLFIPPSLAYGATATSTIPANSYLRFDIQVDNVQ